MKNYLIFLSCLFFIFGLTSCVTWTPEKIEQECRKAEENAAGYKSCLQDSLETHQSMIGQFTPQSITAIVLKDCDPILSNYRSNYRTCLKGEPSEMGFWEKFSASIAKETELRNQAEKEILNLLNN